MVRYPDSPDNDAYLFYITDDKADDPAPLRFRLDSTERDSTRTAYYFTAAETKDINAALELAR